MVDDKLLKKRIASQTLIKKLKIENQKLKIKLEELEGDLYIENNKRSNNKKTVLRVKDIVDMYPVGKSTVWLYAKAGNLTPIKISSRVTTFDAKEVQLFFKTINKYAYDITPNSSNTKILQAIKKSKSFPKSPLNPKTPKK